MKHIFFLLEFSVTQIILNNFLLGAHKGVPKKTRKSQRRSDSAERKLKIKLKIAKQISSPLPPDNLYVIFLLIMISNPPFHPVTTVTWTGSF